MLLVIDIGNTNITVGCFRGEALLCTGRLKTDHSRTSDEYAVLLHSVILGKLGDNPKFRGAVISSVVPPLTAEMGRLVKAIFGVEPIIVGPGIKTGIAIKLAEPGAVGADRIVNAVAAREKFGAPVLVVDFGTATTIDYVSAAGAYEGGIIAPGLEVSLDSLVARTAKLPRIELQFPRSVIGKSTVHAMQSGAMLGYASMVDGLIDRVFEEAGKIERVVATGGLGGIFFGVAERITDFEPDLTLHGMRIIAAHNTIGG